MTTVRRLFSVSLIGSGKSAIEVGRDRLLFAATVMAVAFAVLALRLVEVGLSEPSGERRLTTIDRAQRASLPVVRADIVDRNGVLLATSLPTRSLHANPRRVRDPARVAKRLGAILPDLDPKLLLAKLAGKGSFVWIRRHLSPRQVYAINALGEPGLAFIKEERRVYPLGRMAAHLVGYTGIDGDGLAGAERGLESRLRADPTAPVRLSLDIRFQEVLHAELATAMRRFRALAGAGLVLDVDSGEILAMVSLPDFDPARAADAREDARRNRVTLGTYEMGSTFKAFTVAMALENRTVGLRDGFDASKPLKIARFTIRDYHAENRWLSVPEIFMYSSNIGAAKMALAVGGARQKAFLGRLGLLDRTALEIPEVGAPQLPATWKELTTATVGFGHGLAVTPLQLASGVAALITGELHSATVLARDPATPPKATRVVAPATAHIMRQLMRLVVEHGTGRQAEVPGYLVGGKTGTAEKVGAHGYRRNALLSSFVAAFPINRPRFVVFAMLDEPKGDKETHNYATGGWTVAPAVGRVIARIGPIAGIAPIELLPAAEDAAAVTVSLDGNEIRLAAF